MHRLSYLLCCLFILFTGCRKEDWREIEMALPSHLTPIEATARIVALDVQTPPSVTIQGQRITIRYNTLHLAKKNIESALR